MSDTSLASTNSKLAKAYIMVLPGSSPAGGGLSAAVSSAAVAGASADSSVAGSAANKITFLFNPQEYSMERESTWDRSLDPGALSTSVPQFLGSGPRRLSFEMFLEASYTESGGVQSDVDLLMACMTPTPTSLIMGKPSPPFCLFGWGSSVSFLACMTSLRVEYQLFRSDGTPLRASCQISLEEIPLSLPGQNPTSGGIPRRTRTTVAGDTLQSVAYREYGKASMWRAIAHANDIEDPLRVAPGTLLLIPPPGEASALA